MVKESEPYLTDQTKFWIVRPRVRAGSVSGLDTLLSGSYIGIDASTRGKPVKSFTGLEVPPVVTLGQPGRHFLLSAEALGSLDIGAPVYYRQIPVGQVVGYNLDPDSKEVDIQIFIEAPHHTLVSENTRFWNASGINVSLNAQGLKVNTQSMVSILSGGVAFDLPVGAIPGKEALDYTSFRLYPDQDSIKEKSYTVRNYWMLLFDQSVRGLSAGAPVELYGIKIGEVINLDLEFDAEQKSFQVPVMVAIEPERIRVINEKDKVPESEPLVKWLVEQRGLRAQLKSANLLTGQLMVNLTFLPDAPKATISHRDRYPVVPTIAGSFEQVQENLNKIITNIEKMPFEQIGTELQQTLKEAQNALKQIGGLAGTLNKETTPQVATTLVELQKTLAELQQTIGKDSPLKYSLEKTLEELSLTLRSVRELADTLEIQPDSILFGKEKKE